MATKTTNDFVRISRKQWDLVKARLEQAQNEEKLGLKRYGAADLYGTTAAMQERHEKSMFIYRYLKALVSDDKKEIQTLQNENKDWYFGKANWNEGTNAQGLYAVPDVWDTEIFTVTERIGFARRLFNVRPLSSKNTLFHSGANFTAAAFTSEGSAATLQAADNMLDRKTATAKLLKAAVLWSEELEEDAIPALVDYIREQLALDIATEEDRVGFAGDVSGNSDAFNGLLYQTYGNEVQLTGGNTNWSDIHPDNLLDLQNEVKTGAIDNAIFLTCRSVYSELRKKKVDGATGNYVWSNEAPAGIVNQQGLQGLERNTFFTPWGIPMVVLPDSLWASEGADAPAVVYGDLSRYAIMGVRKQLTTKVFNEYYGSTSLSGQNRVIEFSERLAYVFPNMDAFAVLRLAES